MSESNASRRKRYATNPEYRKKRIARSSEWYAKLTPEQKRHKHRRWNLATKYGMTQADYDAMVKEQGGVCAICKLPETNKNQYGTLPLSIDHCHASNKVRGLLCVRCNPGLGNFRDNPTLLRAAAAYLEKETK